VEGHRIVKKDSAVAVFDGDNLPEICCEFRRMFSCLDSVVQGVSPRAYSWLFRATGVLGRIERGKNRILDTAIHGACSKTTHKSGTDGMDLTMR